MEHVLTMANLKLKPSSFTPALMLSIGGGTIFKVGGGKFLEVKNGASVPAVALARRRGVSEGDVSPSEVGAFLKM